MYDLFVSNNVYIGVEHCHRRFTVYRQKEKIGI